MCSGHEKAVNNDDDEGNDEIVMRCYHLAICPGVIREKKIYDPSNCVCICIFVFVFIVDVSIFLYMYLYLLCYVFGAIRWLSARVSSEKSRFTTQAVRAQFSLLFSHVRLATQCEQTNSNLTFVFSLGS